MVNRKTLAEWAPPFGVLLIALALWVVTTWLGVFPETVFPGPLAVLKGFVEECKSGRLFNDIVASLFRVTIGFTLATLLGIPFGLWLGSEKRAQVAALPVINFFRSLSPIAWIPFAILWLGVGDPPVIFLIFMASFFPIILGTMAAVASVPAIYFRVANDYGLSNSEKLRQVTLPAIAPHVITTLRLTAGLSWLVVVAAEMIAGRDGLGFAIWDARNGLRMDLLVVGMIIIGCIGVLIDRLLMRLTLIPGVRWSYER